MERRFILFLTVSFAILWGYMALMARLYPPALKPAKGPVAAAPVKPEAAAKEGIQPGPRPEQPAAETPAQAKPVEAATEPSTKEPSNVAAAPIEAPPAAPRQWLTLGSADPSDPYRMLVTLDNRGASVARIELSSPRYRDLEDRSGYIGHLVMDAKSLDPAVKGSGCPVQVVGLGTPAAEAGLKPGDLIVAVAGKPIDGVDSFHRVMGKTTPNRQITLTVKRRGEELELPITPGWRPLEVIRPEAGSPSSFLLTLQQFDGRELVRKEGEEVVAVGEEMKGIDFWSSNWTVVSADASQVVFRQVLPGSGVEITKTYRLDRVPENQIGNPVYKAYHLVFDVQIRNTSSEAHKVAYQLDGPNGLPDEGAWYANKIGRSWGAVGLRDVVVSFDHGTPSLIGCPAIADNKVQPPWQDQSLTYIGDDAQYFSSVLIPQKADPREIWFAKSHPLRLGKVDPERKNLTNTSFRVISTPHELAPGTSFSHEFEVFAGPKKPDLLANYGLGELVYYGWFGKIAVPIASLLHGFYAVVGNYGLAILLLTALVRGCMFPLSRKQAIGAQKMQELQPEIKRIQEKYKKDVEGRTKAQQDLFRKHNYNPMSGCLVMFVQLPIFIALYRALMVDIELRQAPLISEAVRWCSNLAAPDMLFNWSSFMPEFVSRGVGIFGLGPYFNVLPLVTIVLFIVQQKMFMPPAADEQAAMQQKVMQYMMIFIGIMFFKVASGLCIYFIASSAWGLAERKFLPKTAPAGDTATRTRADAKADAKALPKPGANGDRNGAGPQKKKKPSRG